MAAHGHVSSINTKLWLCASEHMRINMEEQKCLLLFICIRFYGHMHSGTEWHGSYKVKYQMMRLDFPGSRLIVKWNSAVCIQYNDYNHYFSWLTLHGICPASWLTLDGGESMHMLLKPSPPLVRIAYVHNTLPRFMAVVIPISMCLCASEHTRINAEGQECLLLFIFISLYGHMHSGTG